MLQARAADAMSRSDAEPLYEDSTYQTRENGNHFEISSNDIIDGDKDDLPL